MLTKTHFKFNDTDRLKEKRKEKMYHTNINKKRAGVSILISDNVNIREKKITKRQRDIT